MYESVNINHKGFKMTNRKTDTQLKAYSKDDLVKYIRALEKAQDDAAAMFEELNSTIEDLTVQVNDIHEQQPVAEQSDDLNDLLESVQSPWERMDTMATKGVKRLGSTAGKALDTVDVSLDNLTEVGKLSLNYLKNKNEVQTALQSQTIKHELEMAEGKFELKATASKLALQKLKEKLNNQSK
jgi:hypothetical protein